MLENPWDAMDAVLLTAVQRGEDQIADAAGYPDGVVKDLILGYLASGYITQILPGCDRYQITLSGRRRLSRLTAAMAADTRKAA